MSRRQIYFANHALNFMSKIPLFTSRTTIAINILLFITLTRLSQIALVTTLLTILYFILQKKRSINFNNFVTEKLNQLVIRSL